MNRLLPLQIRDKLQYMELFHISQPPFTDADIENNALNKLQRRKRLLLDWLPDYELEL